MLSLSVPHLISWNIPFQSLVFWVAVMTMMVLLRWNLINDYDCPFRSWFEFVPNWRWRCWTNVARSGTKFPMPSNTNSKLTSTSGKIHREDIVLQNCKSWSKFFREKKTRKKLMINQSPNGNIRSAVPLPCSSTLLWQFWSRQGSRKSVRTFIRPSLRPSI